MKTDQQALAENIYTAILIQYYLPIKGMYTDEHESLIDDLLLAKDLAQKMAGVWHGWNASEDKTAHEAIRKMIYEINKALELVEEIPQPIYSGIPIYLDAAIKIGYTVLGPDDETPEQRERLSLMLAKARAVKPSPHPVSVLEYVVAAPDIPAPPPGAEKDRAEQIPLQYQMCNVHGEPKLRAECKVCIFQAAPANTEDGGLRLDPQTLQSSESADRLVRDRNPELTAEQADPWPHA